MWRVLDTGPATAERNMQIDKDLLSKGEHPILHFYDWIHPSATYGYFIHPELFLKADHSLDLARRPTGGGIVFHLCDLAFSVLVPAHHPAYSLNTMDNYAFVNRAVSRAILDFLGVQPELLPAEPLPADKASSHFCMAKPTKYDVMIAGRKVGGGAQRRTKEAFLHQGTISIGMPEEAFLHSVLKQKTQVFESMRRHSYYLLGNTWTHDQLRSAKAELRHLLAASFML